jgi:hypothetical protein
MAPHLATQLPGALPSKSTTTRDAYDGRDACHLSYRPLPRQRLGEGRLRRVRRPRAQATRRASIECGGQARPQTGRPAPGPGGRAETGRPRGTRPHGGIAAQPSCADGLVRGASRIRGFVAGSPPRQEARAGLIGAHDDHGNDGRRRRPVDRAGCRGPARGVAVDAASLASARYRAALSRDRPAGAVPAGCRREMVDRKYAGRFPRREPVARRSPLVGSMLRRLAASSRARPIMSDVWPALPP